MSRQAWGSVVVEEIAVEVVAVTKVRRASPCKRLLRVVIADDCHDAADSLAMLMRCWGHDVRVVYSGAAVREIVLAYRPDVLLLDIGMPHMDGFVLARHLRGQPCIDDALLVAVTGYADHAHRRLGAEAGFDIYLVKPVALAALEQLLQRKKDQCVDESEAPPAASRPYRILLADDVDRVHRVTSGRVAAACDLRR